MVIKVIVPHDNVYYSIYIVFMFLYLANDMCHFAGSADISPLFL